MIAPRNLFALAALCILSASGCYTFNPYGMPPGMYNQPPMMPGGAGTGQVSYLNGAGTPTVAPQASTFAESVPTPAEPAPAFDREPVSAPDVHGESTGGEAVPAPRDLSPSATGGDQPAVRTSEGVLDTGKELTRVSPDEPVFLKPVVMNEEGDASTVISADGVKTPLVASNSTSELGHDPSYRWIQGDLQYDVQRKTWHLIYDYTPEDGLGGELTLGGNLPFSPSDNDRVYRVYGDFDPIQTDRLGKSVYRVSRVERISR